MRSFENSKKAFVEAIDLMPGGVNSPVRAFKGVGGTPIFFDHAKGAYVFDADGNKYTDYVGSWGPMILGHSAPEILDAVKARMERGLSFGAPTDIEIEMAEEADTAAALAARGLRTRFSTGASTLPVSEGVFSDKCLVPLAMACERHECGELVEVG